MKSLICFTTILITFGLVSNIALGQKIEYTEDWGYMRVNNYSEYLISTKCYDKRGRGVSKWKRVL